MPHKPTAAPVISSNMVANIAVIGSGIAGVTCARTLMQAGHRVSVFDEGEHPGGRLRTLNTPFGSFDTGAQYFTVRDARFGQALATVPGLCKPWSANAVRVLDDHGRLAAASLPAREPHWVATPGMAALPRAWAGPLETAGRLMQNTRVTRIERDALNGRQWQLCTEGPEDTRHVYSGFDAILLAVPATQAHALLQACGAVTAMSKRVGAVKTAPCWTLTLAFPQAMQARLNSLGPQWNAARSTHHRIAWLARESSKPGRGAVERWTVQASAAWSQEHLQDDAQRVQGKLIKAFAEITGIRAEPAFIHAHRWLYAQTTLPLGQTHLWDKQLRLGACGDWCIGHRVEDAFVSGLELALAVV